MNKEEALNWIVKTKAISPLTRNFIIWLYDVEGGIIKTNEELKEREVKRNW